MSASNSPALAYPKGRPRLLDRRALVLERERNLKRAQAFVRKRDKGRCVVCGKSGHEVHHVLYRSQGGKDVPANLALLCASCHQETHAKLIVLTHGKHGWTHERVNP